MNTRNNDEIELCLLNGKEFTSEGQTFHD